MSSLARELGAEQDLDAFATTVSERFGEVYGRVAGRGRAWTSSRSGSPELAALAEPAAALR